MARLILRFAAVAALLATLPISAAAQDGATSPTGPVSAAQSFAGVDAEVPIPASLTTAAAVESTAIAVPQVTGRSGRTYMIAGAAALVGGLLIGGDVGTLLAAGGVVLGVYGILIYY